MPPSTRARSASDSVSVVSPTPSGVATAVRCAVCRGTEARPFWSEAIVQCAECPLVRAADRFFDVDPGRLYNAEYFTGAEYVDYRGDRDAATRNARRRIRVLRRLAPSARTLFEIGSAYGFFLEAADHC